MKTTVITGLIGASMLAGASWLALAETEMAAPSSPVPASASSGPSGPSTPPSFAHIARRVSPAVVTLTTKKWLGSGFVFDRSGLLLTNAHVVEGQKTIKVHFADGTHYIADVVGTDRATDVALLRIRSDKKKQFPAVSLGQDRSVQVGDWVLAIGSPDGLAGTVTAGIVSTIHRDGFASARIFTDYLQIDAAINHGNSGGPTFDMNGKVVGMNTLGSYLSSNCSGKLCERNDGIGFSIPVSTLRMVVEDLKTGPVIRGVVGLLVEPVTEEIASAVGLPNTKGAFVADVVAASPAEKAGIKAGDVILKLNGSVILDDRDLLRRTAAIDEGASARFTLWRDSKQLSVTAKIVERSTVIDLSPNDPTGVAAEQSVSALGLELAVPQSALGAVAGQNGMVVSGLVEGSDAASSGLRVGDHILRVANRDVNSQADVNLAIEQARAAKREYVLVYVGTQMGGRAFIIVKLGTP